MSRGPAVGDIVAFTPDPHRYVYPYASAASWYGIIFATHPDGTADVGNLPSFTPGDAQPALFQARAPQADTPTPGHWHHII